MNILRGFSMALCLGRIATALEDIAAQLRYQNERTFPPLPESKTEGKPIPAIFTRRKRDDVAS